MAPPRTSQTITAYFVPTTATLMLRRGGYLTFSREMSPVAGPWQGVGSARPYVQVAVPGRPFEEILDDDDLNRPFIVIGNIDKEELVEVVTFIRSNPQAQKGELKYGNIGTLPITSLERRPDGSVSVRWVFDRNQGQTAILERQGTNWAAVSLSRWVQVF